MLPQDNGNEEKESKQDEESEAEKDNKVGHASIGDTQKGVVLCIFALFCRSFWQEKTHRNAQKKRKNAPFCTYARNTSVYYTPMTCIQQQHFHTCNFWRAGTTPILEKKRSE